MKTITEDEFFEQYKPVLNKFHMDPEATAFNGCMYETYGVEEQHVRNVAQVNEGFVWTIIDGDDGLSITSGYHYVNRFGYIITQLPADEDFIDVVLEDLTDHDEDEEAWLNGDGDDNILGA